MADFCGFQRGNYSIPELPMSTLAEEGAAELDRRRLQ
jgi:hypothetical protein